MSFFEGTGKLIEEVTQGFTNVWWAMHPEARPAPYQGGVSPEEGGKLVETSAKAVSDVSRQAAIPTSLLLLGAAAYFLLKK